MYAHSVTGRHGRRVLVIEVRWTVTITLHMMYALVYIHKFGCFLVRGDLGLSKTALSILMLVKI